MNREFHLAAERRRVAWWTAHGNRHPRLSASIRGLQKNDFPNPKIFYLQATSSTETTRSQGITTPTSSVKIRAYPWLFLFSHRGHRDF